MKLNIDVDDIAESAREISNKVLEHRKDALNKDSYFFKEIYKLIETQALNGKFYCVLLFSQMPKMMSHGSIPSWDFKDMGEQICINLRGRGFECNICDLKDGIIISWENVKQNKSLPPVFKPVLV